MAASVCINQVIRKKWTSLNGFRYCFISLSNQRTYFRNFLTSLHQKHYRIGTASEVTDQHESCLPVAGLRELKFLSANPYFYNLPVCLNALVKDDNNLFYSGKPSHVQNCLDRNTKCLVRNFSDGNGPRKGSLPNLMEFPEILWPSVVKTLRNWVLANLIITPYFDNEFSLPDFIFGSKQALEYVSGCLSRGDYDALCGMVSDDTLQEVKRNITRFSVHQRQLLAVSKDDIYFAFPYQIGVMFNDDDKNQQRFVEITMVYHTLQGLKDLREQGAPVPVNVGMMSDYRDKIVISNYRFIREFTKGVDSSWTVNVINHFRPDV